MGFAGIFSNFLLSSVFPTSCFVCGSYISTERRKNTPGLTFCNECESGFIFLSSLDVCGVCGNPLAGKPASICGPCSVAERSFSIARSVVFFSGAAASCARDFKYRGAFNLGVFLSSLAVDFFPSDFGDFEIVVPVPLHLRRLRQREFNQSAIISSTIAARLGKEHAPFVLKRVKDTAPQASIKKIKERRNNVRSAFSVRNDQGEKIRNKKVMLFDDIFTTGSTIEECSAALIRAGAEEVKALTVFRTPI